MQHARPPLISADDLAELAPPPQRSGPHYCELCGEQVPPDERQSPRADALCCRACAAAAGLELRSYVSPLSRMRSDQ